MDLKISLSKHAKIAVADREISAASILQALQKPDERFFDISTNHNVTVKRMKGGALIVVYDIVGRSHEIVTVFSTTKAEKIIRKKVEIGYWVRLK